MIELGKVFDTNRYCVIYLSDAGMQRRFGRRAPDARTYAIDARDFEVDMSCVSVRCVRSGL